jgi:hypothetical protein
MIDITSDLAAVFYDTDEFAHVCTPVRLGIGLAPFAGILATLDLERFEGQAIASTHQLQYAGLPSVLQRGDMLLTQRKLSADVIEAPQVWQVITTPVRVSDGQECTVWLSPQGA